MFILVAVKNILLEQKIKLMLNKNQPKAATFPLISLCLQAGVGTGKTQTLIARFNFLKQIIDVRKICVLTFNRKTVLNLKHIIKDNRAIIMTFHGFSLMFLKKNKSFKNFLSFNIITATRQQQIIKNLLQQYQLRPLGQSADELLTAIVKVKKRCYVGKNLPLFFKLFSKLINKY
ncbi:MAG: AAA family ATPase [Vigna little leaf phytoplasma]|nr:AAA family ATPase [Vigna little leaf phytoplasma]